MITVLIPVVVLLAVILCKRIPKIGGNVQVGLVLAGVLSLLLGGVFSPADWCAAFIDGLDRLAWIIFLSIFGSIYAETQVKLGTMDTVMGALKARFGRSPRALVVCIIMALVVAGSLLGDAIAASTVIGVLTIGTLSAMGMSPEHICCVVVMGASMGSIMPPITQALAMSSTLVSTDPEPVITIGYFTSAIVIVLVCIYVTIFFVNKNMVIEDSAASGGMFGSKKASQILRENWTSLVPLAVLIIVVFFRTVTIEGIQFDLVPELLSQIQVLQVGETALTLYEWMGQVTILKGMTNGIVLSLVFVAFISFLFPRVRKDAKSTIANGLSKVKVTVGLQVCAAFMLGCFYAGGQIDQVMVFAQGLDTNLLKIGGAAAMCLIGMLTGSQSTAQNVVFSFFGPALVNIGLNRTEVATAGANIAAAGQGLPPADLTTFVVAGIVGGMLGVKVNPVKSMLYMVPMCLLFLAIGVVFLYI